MIMAMFVTLIKLVNMIFKISKIFQTFRIFKIFIFQKDLESGGEPSSIERYSSHLQEVSSGLVLLVGWVPTYLGLFMENGSNDFSNFWHEVTT